MICDHKIIADARRIGLKGQTMHRVGVRLIGIDTTPCPFGGERCWFLCPVCGRRCVTIYQGFRCRLCVGERYRVEHMSPLDRMFAKARKLRRSLGQTDEYLARPIPEKPKYMKWGRYLRIRTEIGRVEREIVAAISAWPPPCTVENKVGPNGILALFRIRPDRYDARPHSGHLLMQLSAANWSAARLPSITVSAQIGS
ncbi:MAG: hypothetical protein JJT81_07285 [Rubellimicrobium sp.]|nr:hypothetical protein [Rubellimicrobium sp.]